MEFYSVTTAHIGALPTWLQTPVWFWPVTHAVVHFVRLQPALGLFIVIFAEELGVPLPAPGDAAITYAGYLTTTSALKLPLAYAAVISAATIGSFCNYSISRRF